MPRVQLEPIDRVFVTLGFNIRKYSLGEFWASFIPRAADNDSQHHKLADVTVLCFTAI